MTCTLDNVDNVGNYRNGPEQKVELLLYNDATYDGDHAAMMVAAAGADTAMTRDGHSLTSHPFLRTFIRTFADTMMTRV